jgi:leucyl aminopeptidase
MIDTLIETSSDKSIPVFAVCQATFEEWLKTESLSVQRWITSTGFEAKPGSRSLVPGKEGDLERVLFGVSEAPTVWDWATLPVGLLSGTYRLEGLDAGQEEMAALAWGLATYQFDRYREPQMVPPRLVVTDPGTRAAAGRAAEAIYLVRDLINTPANDLGPDGLEEAAHHLAKRYDADFSAIVGDDLLTQNYPAIHAVGRANDRAPRLLDLKWGDDNAPKVTLVGKGVCFDSGGLDLKPASGMEIMKKDMGGAAHVLGIAAMVMEAGLPVRLRVLIPAVENSVSANAMRPGDVLETRKGLSIEIGNTDAEGRVVLADALCEASSENPDMIIDFATLTGAGRIALGTDLPALFANDDGLAADILEQGLSITDPLWRMPLWPGYAQQIRGKVADVTNSPGSRYGGAITAALFLERFVDAGIPWVHVDLMAWNLSARPGRPEGGEAMGVRAVFAMLAARYP